MNIQNSPATAKLREPDPAYAMYEEWQTARNEWNSRSDTDDWEAPHMLELERRKDVVEKAARQRTPETVPQAALVAFLVWDNEGPDARTGTPEYYKELEHPWMQTLLRLREWAESVLEA